MANLKVPTWGYFIDKLVVIVDNDFSKYEEKATQIVDVLSEMYKVSKPQLRFFRDRREPEAAAKYKHLSETAIEFFQNSFIHKSWFLECTFHEFAHHLQKVIEEITGETAFSQHWLSHDDRPHEIAAEKFAKKFMKAIEEKKRENKRKEERYRAYESKQLTCPHCDHTWTLRKGKIKYRRCPKCKRYF